jgi:plasmid replication initiation protein
MDETRQEKQEVVKHSAAIQIESKTSLLEEKIFNWLLAHAYDELLTREIHSIRLQDLMRKLEYHSKNEAYLKTAIKTLVSCSVEWNVLNKDNTHRWGVAALLASAEIHNGVCTYGFAPHLRPILHHPTMYARISLVLQNRFKSKHSLRLWQVLLDYLGAKRSYGESPVIPLAAYRKLMGLDKDEYPNFRDLNQRLVKEPIDEINAVSDFYVTVDYQRRGRKVTALKFKIRRVELLPEPADAQAPLFPELEDTPAVVQELTEAGLSHHDAVAIWQEGFNGVVEHLRPRPGSEDIEMAFLDYVREKIHLLKDNQGKIENSAGYLIDAIRKNYFNPKFAKEQKAQARKAMARELKALEEQKDQVKRAHDDAVHAHCEALIAAIPALLEEAAGTVRQKYAMFRESYQPDMPLDTQYRQNISFSAMIDAHLKKHHPEHFQALLAAQNAELAALDEKIAALNQAL